MVWLVMILFIDQMGAYHTIELELNRKFTLAKKSWDSVVLDRIGKQVLLVRMSFPFYGAKLATHQHLESGWLLAGQPWLVQ